MRRWDRVLWAALAAQRLRELQLSRTLTRDKTGAVADPNGFPLMVAVHVGLFLLPPLEVRLKHPVPRGRVAWVALLLFATGLRHWSIRSLGTEWNVRGLVASDLTPVTSGPYRWVRHPNYLAVMLEFLAFPMAAGAWRSALGLSLLNGGVLWRRIRSEERLLADLEGYQEVFAKKARFIPHLF